MFSSFGMQLNLAEFRTSRLSFLTTLEHGPALTGRYHRGWSASRSVEPVMPVLKLRLPWTWTLGDSADAKLVLGQTI